MSVTRLVLDALGLLPDRALAAGARALFSGSWRRFEQAVDHPREVQTARLLALVSRAQDTAFGREHGFAQIKSLEDFQAKVPIRGYDALEPYLARMVAGEANVLVPDAPFYFGRSSGTTGTPKHIPVTPLYVSEYRLPRRVWARQVMQAFPGLVRGRILSIHSPKIEGDTPAGLPYGSVTVGLTVRPDAVRGGPRASPFDAAPMSLFLVEDFELKYEALLRLAAQTRITLAAAVNPSTLVLLAKKLDQHALAIAEDLDSGRFRRLQELPEPARSDVARMLKRAPGAAARIRAGREKRGYLAATDLWPELLGLLCWKGGSAPFYLAQLERWYPGLPAMDYGFVATEGGFSIPLSPEGAQGVAAVLGHVLEFVPEAELEPALAAGRQPRALLADALEVGARYRVIITGAQGLWRYDINDVVECVGYYKKTAEISFLHKGGNMLSMTGEKISERHVVDAMGRARQATGLQPVGFSLVCELSDPPRYLLGVEAERPLDAREGRALLSAFELALGELNIEYAAKRRSARLAAPRLVLFEAGAFERERARKVAAGAPDSHVKPPHLSRDDALFQRLGPISSFDLEASEGA